MIRDTSHMPHADIGTQRVCLPRQQMHMIWWYLTISIPYSAAKCCNVCNGTRSMASCNVYQYLWPHVCEAENSPEWWGGKRMVWMELPNWQVSRCLERLRLWAHVVLCASHHMQHQYQTCHKDQHASIMRCDAKHTHDTVVHYMILTYTNTLAFGNVATK